MFDATKEMLYIPLNDELKTKGKAAVDILGIKLGKVLGAATQALAFIVFPHATYQDISMVLSVMFALICIIWLVVLKYLARSYYTICLPIQN